MSGTMGTEESTRVDLKGSPANPGRDPKKMNSADKKEVGAVALNDAFILLGAAFALLLFFHFSLRHYNI